MAMQSPRVSVHSDSLIQAVSPAVSLSRDPVKLCGALSTAPQAGLWGKQEQYCDQLRLEGKTGSGC